MNKTKLCVAILLFSCILVNFNNPSKSIHRYYPNILESMISDGMNLIQNYTTYFGGNGEDSGRIFVDKEGYIYLYGATLQPICP